MSNENTTGGQTDQSIDDIDRALQASQARQAAKANAATGVATDTAPIVQEKRKARTPDERKAALAAQEQAREERKAKREEERKAKQSAAEGAKAPAHMKKVDRAAEKLGVLNDAAQALFDEATKALDTATIAALALHLQHFNRVQATQTALATKLEVGQLVIITGGADPRLIGKKGAIAKVSRIRCYVEIPGASKLAYLFTSDVALVAAEAQEASTV